MYRGGNHRNPDSNYRDHLFKQSTIPPVLKSHPSHPYLPDPHPQQRIFPGCPNVSLRSTLSLPPCSPHHNLYLEPEFDKLILYKINQICKVCYFQVAKLHYMEIVTEMNSFDEGFQRDMCHHLEKCKLCRHFLLFPDFALIDHLLDKVLIDHHFDKVQTPQAFYDTHQLP